MKGWQEYGYRYAVLHRKDYDNWEFKEILKVLSPQRGERIVDIGCSTGEFCYILKKNYGVTPVGIDINKNAIEIASSIYPDISFRNIRVDEIEKEEYDAATMIEVIEHLPDPLYALHRIRGLLKTGGRVAVSTPNRWAFIHKLKSVITGFNYLYDPLHIQEFDPRGLASLFLHAGFVLDKVYTKPLGIPFVRHISKNLYWNMRSGAFGIHIFLLAHRRD